ncbi:MAG TPA: mechanosensitive ion channel [Bacillota bacterium]|nr:mechanosensitive ion channel [Bacillota bacterium]
MFSWLDDWTQTLGIQGALNRVFIYSIRALIVILICLFIYFLFRGLMNLLFLRPNLVKKKVIFAAMKRRRIFARVAHLSTPFILHLAKDYFDKAGPWIEKVATLYTIIVIAFLFDAILNVIDDVYRTKPISKKRPIKGILQVVEILVITVLGIVVIATWIDQSPLVLLSGIGAFAAVLTIIFKDALLGFVAGVQITTEDMVHIGDWIEIPKHDVDGVVRDISLISVKVDNFDNTITSIPAYTLVTESFKNWRKMGETGARRIKRAIYVDALSVREVSKDEINSWKKDKFLTDAWICENAGGKDATITNIQAFASYIEYYMQSSGHVDSNMLFMAHILDAAQEGIPVEIYCFTKETEWKRYEHVIMEMISHAYAKMSVFGLVPYQRKSDRESV